VHREYLLELEDACVVELEGGKIHIKQAVDLTAMGAETASLAAQFNRESHVRRLALRRCGSLGSFLP